MTSIRLRLTLLITLSMGAMAGLGYLTTHAFFSLRKVNSYLHISYQMVQTTQRVAGERYSEEGHKTLKRFMPQIVLEHRKEALSEVMSRYENRQSHSLNKAVEFLARTESEYQRFLEPRITYYEKRIHYYGALCLALTAFSLLLISILVRRSVIQPIQDLSKKMNDFVNDRYTYKYSVPPPNEVGHLEGTFNSLAQRVIKNMQDLTALDQAKSDFLSIASHELRTPLTSIKGSLSLLRNGVAGEINDPANHLMQVAESETDRLIRLINDILDLAKIEAGRLPLEKGWYSLQETIQSTFDSLQGLSSTAGVDLVLKESFAAEVEMDRDRIQQVLTNLVSNAIKYSPKDAEVQIYCQTDANQHLLIEVKDQGRGIDPDDQEYIFQKFRQATSPKNPLVKGTGLGLAIAKALIEEHGGDIGVRSTPGQGSTFYFTLTSWRFSVKERPLESIQTSAGVVA